MYLVIGFIIVLFVIILSTNKTSSIDGELDANKPSPFTDGELSNYQYALDKCIEDRKDKYYYTDDRWNEDYSYDQCINDAVTMEHEPEINRQRDKIIQDVTNETTNAFKEYRNYTDFSDTLDIDYRPKINFYGTPIYVFEDV